MSFTFMSLHVLGSRSNFMHVSDMCIACIINLSTKDTVTILGPKTYMPYSLEPLKEDNLSIKGKTTEFILSPMCPFVRRFHCIFND